MFLDSVVCIFIFNLNGSILIIGYPIVLFVYLEGMFNFLFSVMTIVSLFFYFYFYYFGLLFYDIMFFIYLLFILFIFIFCYFFSFFF